jgi:tetratricopeptide (TPR) repeat protein/TolB-like protein
MERNINLAQELLHRRVPQITAIYIAATWGLTQFVDFVTLRYAWSPYLTDLALLAPLLLLPSVLLVSYVHGAPGKDHWIKSERIGVPVNLVVALVTLIAVFSGKDLGAATDTVVVTDEEGVATVRVIPKSEFRKHVSVYFFDAPKGDTEATWLQWGLTIGIVLDLQQNHFLDVRYPSQFAERLQSAGFDDLAGVPLPLAREIAEEQHRDQFVTGTVGMVGDEIHATVMLYETERGRLLEVREFIGTDVLAVADDIATQLRKDLSVPELPGIRDLPVADLVTNEPRAYRLFIDAVRKVEIERDFATGLQLVQQVVAIDPTFALAQNSVGSLAAITGEGDFSSLQTAMDHLYRLPERKRFIVKANYYQYLRKDVEKAFAVLEMWVELFPNDIEAYRFLTQVHLLRNDIDGVVEDIEKILELDPGQTGLLLELGTWYQRKADYDSARRALQRYEDKYPDDHRALSSLASLARRVGDLDEAAHYYDRAILLEPTNIELLVGLAGVHTTLGNFDEAVGLHEEALQAARTPQERARALSGLEVFHVTRGQIDRAIEYQEQRFAEAPSFRPTADVVMTRAMQANRYVQAGRVDDAFRVIESARDEMPDLFKGLVTLAELEVVIAMRDSDEIERVIPSVETMILELQREINRPRLVFAKGVMHQLRDEYDQAIEQYEEVLRTNPADFETPIWLAVCFRELGEHDRAIDLFQKTLELSPFEPNTNYHLAITYDAMGRPGDARTHLERSLTTWSDADPLYEPAKQAREAMARVVPLLD